MKKILNENTTRTPNESFEDYFVRLFENKNVYGLSCAQISDILNAESGNTYGESKWRKDYRKFTQGRLYERKKFGTSMMLAQAREIEKQRIRLADERTAIRALIRDDARRDAALDSLTEAMRKYDPLPDFSPTKITSDGGTMLAILSDLHIGIEFDNAIGKYNTEIAYRRIMEYAERIVQNARINGAKTCCVALAGDLISGVMHTSIRVENREALVKQIKRACEYVSAFVHYLARSFEFVCVYGVGGNHSRVLNKDDMALGEMLDDLIPFYLEARLKCDGNVLIVENKDDMAMQSFQIEGKHAVLVHGDWDDTTERSISKLEHLAGKSADIVICGHLHENLFKDVMGVHVLQGGCMCGSGDEYCIKNRLSCKPSQLSAYFDADGNLCGLFPVTW